VNFDSDEKVVAFRKETGINVSTCASLRDWLVSLEEEGQDIASLDIACHDVKAVVKKDEAGDVLGRVFDVQVKEECVFMPAPTPRKMGSATAPTWEDAGSFAITGAADGWELAAGGHHKLGYLQLLPRWLTTRNEQMQAVTPEKPGVYIWLAQCSSKAENWSSWLRTCGFRFSSLSHDVRNI
jgi:hypothetical protein